MPASLPLASSALSSAIAFSGSRNNAAASGRAASPRTRECVLAIISAAPAPLSDTSPSEMTSRSSPMRKWSTRSPPDLLGRLENHVDGRGPPEDRTAPRRRHQRQLQHARLAQLQLLAPQLIARAVAQRLLLESRRDAGAQQRWIERLEDEVLRAQLDAADDRFDFAQRGNDHDRQIVDAAIRLEPLEHAEAVELRHHDIEQHEIEIPAFDRRQGLEPVGRLLDLVDAEALQPAHQQVPVLRHVIDDQDRGG